MFCIWTYWFRDVEPIGYVYKDIEIYYKELAYVIMKAGKFQVLQGEMAKEETQCSQ